MNILAYVTDRPQLKKTLRFVRHLVKMTGGELTLMTSAREAQDAALGERVFSKARVHLQGLPAETHFRTGKFGEVLQNELVSDHFDLLILGYGQLVNRRRRQLALLLRQALNRSQTDILVVKGGGPTLERVLICTSGTKIGSEAVESGAWYTHAVGARATLLHVTSSVPSMYTGLDELDETLPELLDSATPLAEELRNEAEILEDHELNAQLKLRHGMVADEILREAERGSHDLIVLGATSQEGFMRGFILGDVVREVLERAEISVLVISHAPREAPRPPSRPEK